MFSCAPIATAKSMPQRSFSVKAGMKQRVNSGKPVLPHGSMVILSQAPTGSSCFDVRSKMVGEGAETKRPPPALPEVRFANLTWEMVKR